MASVKQRRLAKRLAAQVKRAIGNPKVLQPKAAQQKANPKHNKSKDTFEQFIRRNLDKYICGTHGRDPKFGLPEVLTYSLWRKGLVRLGNLVQMNDDYLKSIKGIGPKTLKKIRECEDNFPPNIKFGMDVMGWMHPGS